MTPGDGAGGDAGPVPRPTTDAGSPDVVVVGAGAAGCAAAARLARSGRRVLLVEQGTGRPDDPRLLDPDRLPGADDPLVQRSEVTGHGHKGELLAGRVLGGSSAVNGAYFVRPTDGDLHRWASVGGAAWSPDRWHSVLRHLEHDAQLGDEPRHGNRGPVQVTRRADPLHPVTEAFFAAAQAAGQPAQPDLNGGGANGWGPVPRNIAPDGRRCSAATAYLKPVADGGAGTSLEVASGTRALRVLVDAGRATGVELVGPDSEVRHIGADEVVLAAGALASAQLLVASGIGPEALLHARDTAVLVHVPGLGQRAASHVAVDLRYEPAARPGVRSSPLLQGALHLDTGAGPAEVLAICRPYGVATGDDPGDTSLSLRVSGLWPQPLRLVADPDRPQLVSGDLASSVAGLREAVRRTVELVRTPAFGEVVARWFGPDDATLADDSALDRWITEHLTWSHHLCSTVPMGSEADPDAVLDPLGRVRGVDGLRLLDLSVLPDPPRRGPACTAVALGELLGRPDDPA